MTSAVKDMSAFFLTHFEYSLINKLTAVMLVLMLSVESKTLFFLFKSLKF